MARKLPSDIRKALGEGVADIGKAIQDLETRNLIDGLIQSYSKLDKTAMLGKTTYLAESLRKLCGLKGAELIINVLNRGSSRGAWQLIGEVESNDVKQFLEALVMKYGAQYQWLFDPFPNDWERYDLTTKYMGVPPRPVISLKIVDKSGRLLKIESPLTTYVDLVVAQMEHLKRIDNEMEKFGQPHSIQKIVPTNKLKKMKKIAEELLEAPKKE